MLSRLLIASLMFVHSAFANALETTGQFGGYCSGTSSSGVWGFSFGPQPWGYHCQLVQAAVAQYTGAPVTSWRQGYYDMYGPNRVVMNCANNIMPFDGYGSQNLQSAYNYALYAGGAYCIFTVQ